MPAWAQLITACAGLRVAIAIVLYLSDTHAQFDPPPLPWLTYAALAACFGISGLALAVVNKHDARASWLGGIFVLTAAPLTNPFFNGHWIPALFSVWYVRAEAFLPVFLWRFAAEFPSPLVGRPAMVFNAFARVAAVAGTFIALVNLSFIVWPTMAPAWRLLFHPPIGDAGGLYYPILYGLQAASFVALIWRASRGRDDERRRLLLFAIGVVAGALPLLVNVLLETVPAYYAWVHAPQREQVVGGILFGALACIPFVTAYSVLFDQIVESRVVLRAAAQYALARYTIISIASIPLAAFALVIYQQRSQPLEAFVSGVRPLLLGGTAGLAFVTLRSRHRLLALLDRRYFREEYDTRQLLDRLMTDMLHSTTAADLETRLRASLKSSMHADLKLFVPAGAVFVDPLGDHPVSAAGVLVSLASGDVTAMDVDPSDQRTPFRRLSHDEQSWLLTLGIVLIIPLHAPDHSLAGFISLTPKRSGLKYSMDDRRFLTAVAASAALALDNLRLRSSASDASERPARECQSCSKLNRPDASVCSCGGGVLIVSAAPHTLRGIYRFDRRIGSGGMGVVYLARDLNLDRAVAIKTLPALTPDQATRLRTEARAMAAVQHPNLAVIHGIETWQGTPFLIQEFLAGGTLGDRLKAGPIAIRDALRLCATIAEALEHLHTAGIVHRDVKPNNIGFTDREVPKLLDFGLAKLPKLGENDVETDAGTVADLRVKFGDTAVHGGTPAYMSPEALDAAVPARPALDLWALAVVLFECVTARRPFGGTTRDEIKLSASRGLENGAAVWNHSCPADLDSFLFRALSVQAAQRPSTAREFRNELERLRLALP